MKKNTLLILITVLLFIGCIKKNINVEVDISEENKVSKKLSSEIDLTIYPQEIKNHYGISCITNITQDNVNVRVFPSLEAEIITKLQRNDIVRIRGFSNEVSTFNNLTGNWINIIFNEDSYNFIEGWVFSKYVNLPEIEPASLNFIELVFNDKNYVSRIKASYSLEDNDIIKEFWFTDWGKYYIIVWGPYESDYHYSCIPGTYILDKETLELKHVTYLGALDANTGGMNNWTRFTSDFEYLIQDAGTGNDPRGISAWRLSDMKNVYRGQYYGYSSIVDHKIDVILQSFDNEIDSYIQKFKEENPISQEMKESQDNGLNLQIIVEGTIDLSTGERIITGAKYILTE